MINVRLDVVKSDLSSDTNATSYHPSCSTIHLIIPLQLPSALLASSTLVSSAVNILHLTSIHLTIPYPVSSFLFSHTLFFFFLNNTPPPEISSLPPHAAFRF